MKGNKTSNWKKIENRKKRFEQKNALTTQWNRLQALFPLFHPILVEYFLLQEAHDPHHVEKATEASARIIGWWPGLTQDVQNFVSKCKF